jgi:hypothetical protein
VKLRTLAATALVALAVAPARADVLTLKDGRTIEGEIIRRTSDELELKIQYGSIVVRAKDVVKIEKKLTPAQELEERQRLLGPDDASGRVELARFCLDRDLPSAQAAAFAAEAWRLERGNEGALLILAKLDWRLEADEWVASEKWYPAHSFVRVPGKGRFDWITVEEKARRDAHQRTLNAEAEANSAVYNLRDARARLETAIRDQASARKRAAELEAQAPQVEAQRDVARVTLEARESDLRSASRRARDAQRDADFALACDPGRMAAQSRVACAREDERRAAVCRDEALTRYRSLAEQAGQLASQAASARADAESLRCGQLELEAKLPALEAAIPIAQANVEGKKAEEREAERAAFARKERQAREDAARDARARRRA